nr:SPOR domain-containing protein [uncultured Tolumonas sp.]
MTRDYVRSSQPTKRKPAAKAPVGRGKSSNTSNAPFPVVRAVLALALVIGFGIFLYHIHGSSGETTPITTTQAPAEAPIPIEKQRPAKEEFDYMQILQNKEVPVELPDGQVIGDPSKDPQILQQQQKMQDMLRAQQERAKVLAQQQNGQLPADADDDTAIQPANALTTPTTKTVTSSKPASQTASTATPTSQMAVTTTQHTDVRKPRSFAEVIANESNKTSKPTNTTTTTATATEHKTVAQERDEALAMFGKPRPYSAETTATATTHNVATTSTTTVATSKRYMMQCGAFRTADQASSLQSRIAVQGQNAQIREGSNTSGTWHRVILGPYANRPAAEQALNRLKGAGTVQSCTIYSQ